MTSERILKRRARRARMDCLYLSADLRAANARIAVLDAALKECEVILAHNIPSDQAQANLKRALKTAQEALSTESADAND